MILKESLEEPKSFESQLERFRSVFIESNSSNKNREKAWEQFNSIGLPSKKTEVYRYIKLRQLYDQSFELPRKKSFERHQIESWIEPACKHSVAVFVNGDFVPSLSDFSAIPKQATFSTLEEASLEFGTFYQNHWARSLKEETDPFAALNAFLHGTGAFLYIPPKTVIETPIQILHLIDTEQESCVIAPRLTVFAGAHSSATLISTQRKLSQGSDFVNAVIEFVIEENAHLHFSQIITNDQEDSWHFEAVRAQLKRNATFKTVCVTNGSKTVRTDYRVSLIGENANTMLNGIWMLKGKNEFHTNVLIDHQAPHCQSFQLFKGVLNDFSRSSFEGKIFVRRPAQKTEAFQLNNNLLLSDHSHADSKPNLEIFADDVKASHGATVGQLDPEQMFYMKTRGFEDFAAKNLLIYGFCEQVIEMIPIESIKQRLSDQVKNYLVKVSG